MSFTEEKKLVWSYFEDVENATPNELQDVMGKYVSKNYNWKGVYPFREITSLECVIEKFWKPLKQSFTSLQRRPDIFIGGTSEIGGEKWVMCMGHFMGLFDKEWLNIPPTGKMTSIRFAEFNCVQEGKITKTGLFIDLIGVMQQAGLNPLPVSTGQFFVYPGPRDHNGILKEDAAVEEGIKTMALVNKMVDDLSELNDSGSMGCPPELLEKSWSKDMIWYGPAGIGASYTIDRYQMQHQLPFRNNLDGKKFNGHVCRFAEGNFACFFGWPNLTNRATGGFLGMTSSANPADMQVVDVYYRKDNKLSENWVLIDLPYWLKQQGVDILERTTRIQNYQHGVKYDRY